MQLHLIPTSHLPRTIYEFPPYMGLDKGGSDAQDIYGGIESALSGNEDSPQAKAEQHFLSSRDSHALLPN